MKKLWIGMIALSVVAVCGISANAALPSNEEFTTGTFVDLNQSGAIGGGTGSELVYFDFDQYAGVNDTGFHISNGVFHVTSNTEGSSARTRAFAVFIDTSGEAAGDYSVSFDVSNWAAGDGTMGFKVFEGAGLDTQYLDVSFRANSGTSDKPARTGGTANDWTELADTWGGGSVGSGITGNGKVTLDFTLTQAGTAGDYLGLGWAQVRSTSTNLAPTMDIDNVAVFLRSVNAPPVAYAQPDGEVVVNAFQTFTLTGSDPEDSSLTFSVVDSPAHGELTGTPPNLTYTPDTDFEGNDSFTFKANDGALDSAPATVSILVHTNWMPIANQQGVTVTMNSFANFTLTGSDPEGASLTYSVTDTLLHGVLTGTAPNNLIYTPNTDYQGLDSFTFTVNDGYTDSAPASVSFWVPQDTPPAPPTGALASPFEGSWGVRMVLPSQLWPTELAAWDTTLFSDQFSQLTTSDHVFVNVTHSANASFFTTPNPELAAALPAVAGSFPTTRDILGETLDAIDAAGKKAIVYVACEGFADANGKDAWMDYIGQFGMTYTTEGTREFIVRYYSKKYGDKIDGWWFDGSNELTERSGPNEVQLWKDAVRSGNPDAICAFNKGSSPNFRCLDECDYFGGHPTIRTIAPFWSIEYNYHMVYDIEAGPWLDTIGNPVVLPEDGALGHVFMGMQANWTAGDLEFPAGQAIDWTKRVVAAGGMYSWAIPRLRTGNMSEMLDPQFQLLLKIDAAMGGATDVLYEEDFSADPGYVSANLSAIGAVGSTYTYFTFDQYNGTPEIGVTTDTGVLHFDSNTTGSSARSRGVSVFIDTSAAVAGTYTVSFDVSNWIAGTGTAGFKVVEGSGLNTGYIELDNADNNDAGSTPNFGGTATDTVIGTTGAGGTGISGNGTVSFDVELTEAGQAGDYLALAWVQVRSTSGALAPTFDIDNVTVDSEGAVTYNAPPVANRQSVEVMVNSFKNITLSGYDPEGGNLTYSVVDTPTNGVLLGATDYWTYTPHTNYTGPDRITFTVNDGELNSNPATVNITVSASANQAPAFTVNPINKANGLVDAAYSGSIAGDASDPESDEMTFSKVSGPDWLIVASNGALSGTPAAGDVGLKAFTVQVSATGGTGRATLNITVDALPADFRKEPYLFYMGTNTSMKVVWQADATPGSQTLAWGLDTSYSTGSSSGTLITDDLYEHIITGLPVDTKIYYRVTIDGNVIANSFRTAPADTAGAVTMFAFGDTRTYPADMAVVMGKMVDNINGDASARQTFAVHVADWINDGSLEDDWDTEYFVDLADAVTFRGMLPVNGAIGNHEDQTDITRKYLRQPYASATSTDYYSSFDYGPVHVIILDQYVPSYTVGSTQYNWLVSELQNNQDKHIIVVYHEPAWGAGNHTLSADAQALQPLWEMYGVKLIINGHNHNYSRAVVNGVNHCTVGGGGAPLRAVDLGWDNVVSAINCHNYARIDVDGNLVNVTIYNTDNDTVFETFQFTKTPHVVVTYSSWALSHNLTGADADEKADVEYGGLGDGLDNLMEYALGGNPTNDDAAAVSPDTFMADVGGTNWFYHVHNQNTDTNLTFTVGATTNLVATAADTNDVEWVGATAETNGFKTVTNRTEMTTDAKFIKLEVSK